jgi:hypothetical protein
MWTLFSCLPTAELAVFLCGETISDNTVYRLLCVDVAPCCAGSHLLTQQLPEYGTVQCCLHSRALFSVEMALPLA